MPRMGSEIYAAHMDRVLKLASRDGGVSRPQLIKELGVSRPVATKLIEKCGLEFDRKDGRTEYFSAPNGTGATPKAETLPEVVEVKQSTPAAVQAAVVPTSDDTGTDEELDSLAELDEEIVETRNALREAAAKAGKALGEWATHQALVDALRQRMTELAERRMRACS